MEELFQKYEEIESQYKNGLISKFMKDEMEGELFSKSGYDSPIPFYIDYRKWKKHQYVRRYKQLKLWEDN